MVTATIRPATAALATFAALAAATALAYLTASTSRAVAVALATLVAVLVALATTRRARTALGGTTGDVLGAAIELALPLTLTTLALTPL